MLILIYKYMKVYMHIYFITIEIFLTIMGTIYHI